MVNNVVLVGRLTKDPGLRYTSGDIPVASFVLAVDRNYTNSDGEKEADFIPVVTWRKLAEIVSDNLQKGRLVAVVGRIQTRNWDDEEGQRHWATEVVADDIRFLDKAKGESTEKEVRKDGQQYTNRRGK